MPKALGYCVDVFNPLEPGRLCRGRERWIESGFRDPLPMLRRVVVSGAEFSDDSANDARRGLGYSGFDIGSVVSTLFPDSTIAACAEEAPPLQIPSSAGDIEHFTLTRPGRPLREMSCRWVLTCRSGEDINAGLSAGADVFLVLPKKLGAIPLPVGHVLDGLPHEVPPLADDEGERPEPLPEPLRQMVYLLTGFGQGTTPLRRFQGAAIADLLEHVEAVVLVHQDKHSPCIGVYTSEETAVLDRLLSMVESREILTVPFAIPPMLARWDRALWELRQEWDEAERGAFPVEVSPPDRQSWGNRQRQRAARSAQIEE